MSTKPNPKTKPAAKPASKKKPSKMSDQDTNQALVETPEIPAKETFPIEVLPFREIKATAKTQVRAALNPEALKNYTESAKEWKEKGATDTEFPPLVIFRDADGKNHLADGFTRLNASKEAGYTEHRCEIRTGTQLDAFLYGCKVNSMHGVPLSNKDKRVVLSTALENKELVKKSNNELAGLLGVSEGFVRLNRPKNLCPDYVEVKGKGGKVHKASTKKGAKKKGKKDAEPEPDKKSTLENIHGENVNTENSGPGNTSSAPPNADEQQEIRAKLDDETDRKINKIVGALNSARKGYGDEIRKAIDTGALALSKAAIKEWGSTNDARIVQMAPLLTLNKWSPKQAIAFLDRTPEAGTKLEHFFNLALVNGGIAQEIVDGHKILCIDLEKWDVTRNLQHNTISIKPKGFVEPADNGDQAESQPPANTLEMDDAQQQEEELAGV